MNEKDRKQFRRLMARANVSLSSRGGAMETEFPFDEIASLFPKGMIPWLKRNEPDRWDQLLALEKVLNQASFELNEGRIQELLIQYRNFVRSLAQEFESRKRGSRRRDKGSHVD